jgi:tetratricopeptide (TPR) repeat protein
MTKIRHKFGEPKSRPTQTKQRRVPNIVLIFATLAMLALGWFMWYWSTAPAPPSASFAEVDPAVAAAIEAARRQVWWRPHSAAAWGRLGQLLRAHSYESESNICFAQAEQLDPKDPRWPYLQGSGKQLNDPPAAVRHLQRAVALCGHVPDGPELCLAEVCLQQGFAEDAEQHFRHILQHDPDNARAHLGLGRLACERGNLTDGLAHLNRSASSKWTQRAAAILLAQAYYQLGDATAANRERDRAADLPADLPWPDPFLEEVRSLTVGKQYRLARLKALNQQGRAGEVRSLAATLEDDYPDVFWLEEGREQMDKGNLPAAEQALHKALQLAPNSVDAHFDLGTVLFKQENYRAAAESFRRVTELQPDYGPAYESLGRCSIMQGNRQEALGAFRLAVQYMPQNAEVQRELGALEAQQGQVDMALEHLRRAMQLQPGDAKTRELLDQISRPAPKSKP